MLEKLLNQTAAPVLERSLAFNSARHKLLADNVVNLSTPGHTQRDLDEGSFRSALARAAEQRDRTPFGSDPFARIGSPEGLRRGELMFHDGGNRNAEQLMTDQAKNALQHNLNVELLRKQFGLFHMALRERLA